MTVSGADSDTDGELSEEELMALTVSQLKAVAAEMGITLTATKKADIVAEILEAQAAAAGTDDPDAPGTPDTPGENTPADPDTPGENTPGENTPGENTPTEP